MENRVLGLHHVTAIAGNAKQNHYFYTEVLALRLVKKTVNFDDPGTYHFYFGDEVGTPGSILTFFPWQGAASGTPGLGQATEVVYAVPQDSLPFWKIRLQKFGVTTVDEGTRFGESFISFKDPDGLPVTFLAPGKHDPRKGWETAEVGASNAVHGFHSVTLTLNNRSATQSVLELLGYSQTEQEGNRYRYATNAIETAAIIDIVETTGPRGVNAAGTIHHIAFRVNDEQVQMELREKILAAGYQITPKVDRNYFFSLYFREPGGVLFEIATDNPGFAIDESVSDLGKALMLPPQYEAQRSRIEEILPVL